MQRKPLPHIHSCDLNWIGSFGEKKKKRKNIVLAYLDLQTKR